MGCCNYNNTYSLPINNQWFWIILIIAVSKSEEALRLQCLFF